MMATQLSEHISKQFDIELETIRESVLNMGGLVEHQLIDALKALMDSDIALAQQVLIKERQVNTFEVEIDEECTRVLAKRQPAASDLRLITAVIKTITDLERIGDEAQKIAKMAMELADKQAAKPYYVGIKSMGNHVQKMLRGTLDAFARVDSKAALMIASLEPESDDQYSAIIRQLITYMMEDPRNISATLDAVWAARALERIADHARNICEYVIYFVEGKDVRHITIEEMEREIR